jgi:radical SAM superfamily enzyme YgiQ (UPF0313 family)
LVEPDVVVEELTALLGQGIDHFHTCDSEFNLPGPHAKDVCRAIIDAGLGSKIRWYAYCAPIPFDEELASLFRRAGGVGIDFGADSGCDAVLRGLGRPFSSRELQRTAAICRQKGISFMYDLLLGGPGETRASMRETMDCMRRIQPDCVGLSLGVRLYPGTPLTRTIQSEGPLETNPNVYGAKRDNPSLLEPVFYIAPELGEGIFETAQELVAGDRRFFLPEPSAATANYNYNDNAPLEKAIRSGARGAYWDILRRRVIDDRQ